MNLELKFSFKSHGLLLCSPDNFVPSGCRTDVSGQEPNVTPRSHSRFLTICHSAPGQFPNQRLLVSFLAMILA